MEIVITKHAIYRARERVGLSKTQLESLIPKIMKKEFLISEHSGGLLYGDPEEHLYFFVRPEKDSLIVTTVLSNVPIWFQLRGRYY